jgi:glycosyltransferase involved in cell wall biosynthesis
MRILMMTNTFAPHVGGVARSVGSFTRGYRERGHEVLVVAPEFEGAEKDEAGVVRIPAIQRFNGSDFSVVLPITAALEKRVNRFRPDVIHSHHPFLMGGAALRLASGLDCPLVFTHHTMYERYTHYVPGDSEALKRFVIELSTRYANLCDQVFAPSASIADTLRRRGIRSPVDVVPTGIRVADFAEGDGARFRRLLGIPAEARVIGHVGRLAPEKNLEFLAEAVARLLKRRPDSHFLVVGSGPSEGEIRRICDRAEVGARLHLAGKRVPPELGDAYRAMDLFAFASTSETQGLVVAEAMTAGVPVVAIDAPGAREVVKDGRNGLLLRAPDAEGFAAALEQVLDLDQDTRERWQQQINDTAAEYSESRCVERALDIYRSLERPGERDPDEHDRWHVMLRTIRAEWRILKDVAHAAGAAARRPDEPRAAGDG